MRTPHLSVNQGKRVSVKLRDGTVIAGKFMEKKSGRVIIAKDVGGVESIPTVLIRSFVIVKGGASGS